MANLTLNLIQGSVSFSFSPEAAQGLQREIEPLLQSLKATAQAAQLKERPQKQNPLEYRYTGEILLEIFCNPNLYASPFAAKVLLTLRDERIRLVTEMELTQLLADLEAYLA
jgi:hypothetical protein